MSSPTDRLASALKGSSDTATVLAGDYRDTCASKGVKPEGVDAKVANNTYVTMDVSKVKMLLDESARKPAKQTKPKAKPQAGKE